MASELLFQLVNNMYLEIIYSHVFARETLNCQMFNWNPGCLPPSSKSLVRNGFPRDETSLCTWDSDRASSGACMTSMSMQSLEEGACLMARPSTTALSMQCQTLSCPVPQGILRNFDRLSAPRYHLWHRLAQHPLWANPALFCMQLHTLLICQERRRQRACHDRQWFAEFWHSCTPVLRLGAQLAICEGKAFSACISDKV